MLAPDGHLDDDIWDRVAALWMVNADGPAARAEAAADAATLRAHVATGRARVVLATVGPRLLGLRVLVERATADVPLIRTLPGTPEVERALRRPLPARDDIDRHFDRQLLTARSSSGSGGEPGAANTAAPSTNRRRPRLR